MNICIKKHSAALIISICLLIGVGFSATAAAESPVGEYQVKAAFLYNFIKFVEWPEAAFLSPDAPIIIGIAGENPFGEDLDNLVKGKTIRKRTVEIRQIKDTSDGSACHVIFIGQSEEKNAPAMVKKLGTKSVLTVSEIPNFLENGGMINFVTKKNKVRFEVNIDASTHAALQISSKLLNLALRVKGNVDKPKH